MTATQAISGDTSPSARYIYTDSPHKHYYGGKQISGISGVAKIAAETFLIEAWDRRQVITGMALDQNLVENTATHIDNDQRLNEIVQQAREVAGAHRKADRGTQMHRALEIVLLDQSERLLTEQQKRDATALRATLDRYGLEPTGWAETLVLYPEQKVAGRFDAILKNRDGVPVMTDLKSGLNAVRYPHPTVCQLALYANAPWAGVATEVRENGNGIMVTEWAPLPADLDRSIGYVIQMEPDSDIGALYELNLEHGWAGAQLALDIIKWRKAYGHGDELAKVVPSQMDWLAMIQAAQTRTECRVIWRQAHLAGELDAILRGFLGHRASELPVES